MKTIAPSEFHLPTPAPILSIEDDNYRTRTFVLDARIQGKPGQFVMAWLPRFDEKPFSLVDTDPVTLMITAVGPFTRLIHEKKIGEPIWIRGPFGQGFHVDPSQRQLVLVGGGYGVAPLLWLARSQNGRAETVTVIIGARTAQDVLYADRFRQWAIAAGGATRYDLRIMTEDGSLGEKGLVTKALHPLLENGSIDGIFACGPHGMLGAVETAGANQSVPTQLSWEAYMRCGIGICGACEHEGKVLCLDGPVLPGRK